MLLTWQFLSWNELTAEKLYKILALRSNVFVVEQECAYLDPDEKDQDAMHLLAFKKETLIAYVRIFLNQSPCIIGRVVVHQKYRGLNIGRALMKAAIEKVSPKDSVFISAQEQLKAFYASLGFSQSGKGYLEDGMPHIPMMLPPRHANG